MNTGILLIYLGIIAISYLIGSIPWGYIIARTKGIDIREHGSGNIGATNVRRVLGKKSGILCFLLDFLKGLTPVLTVSLLQKHGIIPKSAELTIAFAAFASVAGHIWTVFLNFKGGKGIATSAGAILAMAPYSILLAGLSWIIVFYVSRYVSLASIVAAVILPVTAVIFNLYGIYRIDAAIQVLLVALGALAVIRHRNNIKRLLNGTENRFVKTSKSDSYATLKKEEEENDEGSDTK